MSKFEGTVEDIVYRNDQNGWTVASVKLDGDRRRISAVGIMPFLSTGEHAIFDGDLTEHREYGKQIKVASYEATRPETKSGVERFLASGLIRGVGPATAKLIVEYFGARALDVLESEPQRLTEVDGIGPKRAAMIAESFAAQNGMRNTLIFLQNYGLSAGLSMKVYKAYGDMTESVLRANPYRLVDEINGVGFHTADEIAMSLGFGRESEFRLRSGVKYVLSEAANSAGHVYLPRASLVGASARILSAEPELVEAVVKGLVLDGELVAEAVGGGRGRLPAPLPHGRERDRAAAAAAAKDHPPGEHERKAGPFPDRGPGGRPGRFPVRRAAPGGHGRHAGGRVRHHRRPRHRQDHLHQRDHPADAPLGQGGAVRPHGPRRQAHERGHRLRRPHDPPDAGIQRRAAGLPAGRGQPAGRRRGDRGRDVHGGHLPDALAAAGAAPRHPAGAGGGRGPAAQRGRGQRAAGHDRFRRGAGGAADRDLPPGRAEPDHRQRPPDQPGRVPRDPQPGHRLLPGAPADPRRGGGFGGGADPGAPAEVHGPGQPAGHPGDGPDEEGRRGRVRAERAAAAGAEPRPARHPRS